MMTRFDHGYGFFGVAGWIGLVAMFVFWIAVIALVIWGISALLSSTRHAPPADRRSEDTATRILRERFARGEIDAEQFEQARRTLEGDTHSTA